MSDRIHILAKAELQRTDWKLMRALERSLAGAEWCDWRDTIRRLVTDNEGVTELPPEPPFGAGAGLEIRAEMEAPQEPAPDGEALPPVDSRMAPEWLEIGDGENIADAAARFTKDLRAELSNLTNKRLDGQRVDETRMSRINEMIEELVKLGGG